MCQGLGVAFVVQRKRQGAGAGWLVIASWEQVLLLGASLALWCMGRPLVGQVQPSTGLKKPVTWHGMLVWSSTLLMWLTPHAAHVMRPLQVHGFLGLLPNTGLHALKPRDAVGVGEKDKLEKILTSQVRVVGMAMGGGGAGPAGPK